MISAKLAKNLSDGCSLTADETKMLRRVELSTEESEHIAAEPYSYWKSVFRVFLKKPSAIIGLSCFFILLLGIIIIPCLCPAGWLEADITLTNLDKAPSLTHWFGTTSDGIDLFFACWTGLRKSLILALISTVINIIIGTLVGLAWGFIRKLDPILIEIYNLVSNIPSLLLYMLLGMVFSVAFPYMAPEIKLVICLCLFDWIGVALFIRNFTLIITNREYNVASKTLGTPTFRIMLKNLLPFLSGLIITEISLMIPGMISSEVTMSYFGFGLPTTTISVGVLLDNGRKAFDQHPWQLLAPACTLAFVIFIFYLLGLALSDALDPKKHR